MLNLLNVLYCKKVQYCRLKVYRKEAKPQKVVAKEDGCSQSAVSKHIHRKLSALRGLSSKDLKMYGSFTRSGLRECIKSHH